MDSEQKAATGKPAGIGSKEVNAGHLLIAGAISAAFIGLALWNPKPGNGITDGEAARAAETIRQKGGQCAEVAAIDPLGNSGAYRLYCRITAGGKELHGYTVNPSTGYVVRE